MAIKRGEKRKKKPELQRAKKEKTGLPTDRAGPSKLLNGHMESVLHVPIMPDKVIHVSEKKYCVCERPDPEQHTSS